MSVHAWLDEGSNRMVAGIGAAAAAAGLLTGLYLQLPGYLAEPIFHSEPQYIDADDPGLAKYKEVVAQHGGLGATFVVPAAFYRRPAADPTPPRFLADTDRLAAEIEAQVRESERRVAWRQDHDEARTRWETARWEDESDAERWESRRERTWPDRRAEPPPAGWRRAEAAYEPYRRAEPEYRRYEPEYPRYEPEYRRYEPAERRYEPELRRSYGEPVPPPPPVPSVRWEPAPPRWYGG